MSDTINPSVNSSHPVYCTSKALVDPETVKMVAKFLRTKTDITMSDEAIYKISEHIIRTSPINMFQENVITYRTLYALKFNELMIMLRKIDAVELVAHAEIDALIDTYYEMEDAASRESGIKMEANCDKICNKCNNQNVYRRPIYTRAADEPVTVYHKCLTCGSEWRLG